MEELKENIKEIYNSISKLFPLYTKSYNFKIKKEDALLIRKYAYEIKSFVDKK